MEIPDGADPRTSNVKVFPEPVSDATMLWEICTPVSKLIVYGFAQVISDDQDVVLAKVIVQDFFTWECVVDVAMIVPVREASEEEPVYVPVMTPVDESMENPCGRLPDQVKLFARRFVLVEATVAVLLAATSVFSRAYPGWNAIVEFGMPGPLIKSDRR